MGIYISGVEMPTNGKALTIQICPDGSIYQPYRGTVPRGKAIPVPPHGRLINGDARVNVQLYNDEFEDFQTVNMSIDDLLDSSWIELEDDPTIIPASKEGE